MRAVCVPDTCAHSSIPLPDSLCVTRRQDVRLHRPAAARRPPLRPLSTRPPSPLSPRLPAFVFPGGKICVYTGLLQLLDRDPDLLAMVMG